MPVSSGSTVRHDLPVTEDDAIWDGVIATRDHASFNRYNVCIETLRLGDEALEVGHLTDFDQLYEELIARGDEHDDVTDERIPYWSELWPCAIAMADFIQHNPSLVAGKDVLELGCGAGLAGLSAHAAGGRVVYTDYLQDALDFAAYNWQLNFPGEAVTTTVLDWRQPDAAHAADVVLGADIAYEEQSFQPILDALKILTRPGGTVLIAEENRFFARGFLAELARLGHSHTASVRRVRYRTVTSRVNLYQVQM